jgi:hypothetical protein
MPKAAPGQMETELVSLDSNVHVNISSLVLSVHYNLYLVQDPNSPSVMDALKQPKCQLSWLALSPTASFY